jgi:hypothetical protein
VRLGLSPVFTTVLANIVPATLIAYRLLTVPKISALTNLDYAFAAIYALFVLMLTYRAIRLKLRVSDLVTAIAKRVGLGRVLHGKADWQAPEKPVAKSPIDGGDTISVSAGSEGAPISPGSEGAPISPGAEEGSAVSVGARE